MCRTHCAYWFARWRRERAADPDAAEEVTPAWVQDAAARGDTVQVDGWAGMCALHAKFADDPVAQAALDTHVIYLCREFCPLAQKHR